MDDKQELLYLQQLVLDASTWRLSEGDDRDCIRLEVQDRLRRLAGQEHARRRVRIGKRYAWVLKEHTERVPREDSPNRTRWAVKAEFADLYKKEAT